MVIFRYNTIVKNYNFVKILSMIMLIADRVFVLYSQIIQWMSWFIIYSLWAVTVYIGINLFTGQNVTIPTPFTTNSIITNDDISDFDTGTYRTDGNYDNFEGVPLMISQYDPALFGTNCQEPCSLTSSGERVVDWIDKNSLACPQEFPDFTKIEIDGVVYTCIDSGGRIIHVQKGENDPALANNRGVDFFAAEEEHIWVDILSSASTHNKDYYYTQLVYDWSIVTDEVVND